ncbi:MAG: class IV adenylate cyclase [Mariniblastus sp.]|nr:class IV adenylate cyclase [Mariniblastus sp.]
MGRNVEIKARLSEPDWQRARRWAEQNTTEPHQVLHQTDTFFHTSADRLKLRQFADGSAELIGYTRSDQAEPAESGYTRTPIPQPEQFLQAMRSTVGIRGVVGKRRDLFMVGPTRVHLDRVDQLGTFLELEVVLEAEQTFEEGRQVAESLLVQLGIRPEQLVSPAYIDLLEASEHTDATA